MKTRIVLWIFLIVTGFVNIAAAFPGIELTTGLPSYSLQGSSVVAEYLVTISNLDAGFDTDGDGVLDCCAKTVTSIVVDQDGWSGSGWTYSFNPDPTITTLTTPDNYGSITTTLTITAPSGTVDGDYSHKVTAEAVYDLYIPDNPSTTDDESLLIPGAGFDSDYDFFNTEISGSNPAPIPEFPTVALPIVSVLGLMFLLRKK
jgi:hypothetical protein